MVNDEKIKILTEVESFRLNFPFTKIQEYKILLLNVVNNKSAYSLVSHVVEIQSAEFKITSRGETGSRIKIY